MICEACNTNNTDDAAFCAECGRPFGAAVPGRLVKHSFSQRILGAIMLRSAMYEEIEADTTATYEVLLSQLDRYDELENNVSFLSEFSSRGGKFVDTQKLMLIK